MLLSVLFKVEPFQPFFLGGGGITAAPFYRLYAFPVTEYTYLTVSSNIISVLLF